MPEKDRKTLFLGEILIQKGWLTWEKLEEALSIQKETGRILGDILVDRGYISKENLFRALAVQYNKTYVDFSTITIPEDVPKKIPKALALKHKCIPLVLKGNVLLIAISNPMNVWAESEIRKYAEGYEVHIVLATPEDIEKAISEHYGLDA